MRGPLATLAVVAVLAAACSDSVPEGPLASSPSTTAAPTSTTTTTTTTTPATSTATTRSPSPTTTIATDAPGEGTRPPPTTTTAPAVPFDELRLAYREVAAIPGQAVFLTAPEGDPRLFVADQAGRVFIVDAGEVLGEPFLDIRSLVRFRGEQGLLGMAFHPGYLDNGRFFVHYSDGSGASNLVEYRVSADDPNRADPDSARRLLTVEQPAGNHNGGMIAFGPDGYLFVGLGDGGGSDDRFGNGQRPDTLLGTVLRLDVDGGDPYAIPAGNPFADGAGGAPEVWAFGLRNPWRFAFDGAVLYIADVGQNRFEEVDVVDDVRLSPGLNFGWPIMEAAHCFRPASGCDTQGLEQPVVEYDHGAGCSVTGGYVYAGEAIPALQGHYLYSDFCRGWLRSFRWDGAAAVDRRDWTELGLEALSGVTSFGVDGFGEVYVLTADGRVLMINAR